MKNCYCEYIVVRLHAIYSSSMLSAARMNAPTWERFTKPFYIANAMLIASYAIIRLWHLQHNNGEYSKLRNPLEILPRVSKMKITNSNGLSIEKEAPDNDLLPSLTPHPSSLSGEARTQPPLNHAPPQILQAPIHRRIPLRRLLLLQECHCPHAMVHGHSYLCLLHPHHHSILPFLSSTSIQGTS